MMKFIRDQAWQFILGTLAIIIAIITFWFTYTRRELSYEILSLTPLFNISEEARGNIQVLFNGKPADNTYLAIIRIYNSGNVPILRQDQDTPISVVFNDKVNIISVEILQNYQDSITSTMKISKTSITLDPVLINSGEAIVIKVLADQYQGDISITSRIVGVNKILLRSTKRESMILGLTLAIIGICILFGPTLVVNIMLLRGKDILSNRIFKAIIFLVFVSFIVILYGVFLMLY